MTVAFETSFQRRCNGRGRWRNEGPLPLQIDQLLPTEQTAVAQFAPKKREAELEGETAVGIDTCPCLLSVGK
jgi:hypothetical protein